MGMLEYMAAGAVKAGTDTYLEISKEGRADKRKKESEGRSQDVWAMREKTLQANRLKVKEFDRSTSVSADKTRGDQSIQLEGIRQGGQNSRNNANIESKRDSDKLQSLGQGQKLFERQDDGSFDQVASVDPKASGSGSSETAEMKLAKYFRDSGKILYKIPDMDSMNEDQRATMARFTSVSTQLSKKYPDIDLNTVSLKTLAFLRENESQSIDQMERKIAKLKEKDGRTFMGMDVGLNEKEKTKLNDLESGIGKARADQHSSETPNLGKPGMLSREQSPVQKPMVDKKPAKTNKAGQFVLSRKARSDPEAMFYELQDAYPGQSQDAIVGEVKKLHPDWVF